MSAEWDAAALLEPISAGNPCGENLEDSAVLTSFDALRLYGRTLSLDAASDGAEGRPPVDWNQLRTNALDALTRSKDLRLLAHLGTATLRTDGLPAFTQVVAIAAQWLDTYWASLYPPVDEDALARRSALNCFADLMAVVDRVRRSPLVDSRKHGRFSLRDIDLASGQQAPGEDETKPDEAAVHAAFLEMPLDELTTLEKSVSGGLEALKAIEEKMRAEGGTEMVPTFGPLTTLLARIRRFVQERLAQRTSEVLQADGTGADSGADSAGRGYAGGAVRSRDEAIRALDAVAEFFRRHEPSSPVPLMVERAKRLVSMDFLEALAEIAPDAVPTARSAAGLRDY